jgi:hypothetical protein
MCGRSVWIKWDTTDGGISPPGSSLFSRDAADVGNVTFMVDSNDSNLAYLSAPVSNSDGRYLAYFKLSLNPLRIMQSVEVDLDNSGGAGGVYFFGQNDDYVFCSAVSRRGSNYGYPRRVGRMDKSSLSIAGTLGDTKQSKMGYICQDDNYSYLTQQSTYSTNWLHVVRIGKDDNVDTNLVTQNAPNTGYYGWTMHSQAIELTTDKKSIYSPFVTTDAALAFEIYRQEVDLGTDTATSTQCTFDFTTISGGRAVAFNKPTQTGEGRTNLEAFVIEDTSANYMCFMPVEHSLYTNEASATFRLYIFKIDASDPNHLIYKDHIDTNVRAWSIFPVQDDWEKIAIIHSSGLKFYNWNSSNETFDFVQDTSYSPMSVMRDSNDRIWVRDNDGAVHMISATSPTRVVVTMEHSSYNYQGADISTYADVSAYNVDNDRIAANVKLALEGSIYFTDSSQSKTITTSSSGETQVSMTIKGSSYTRILASVVV